jgi:protoheme ferro-lyase
MDLVAIRHLSSRICYRHQCYETKQVVKLLGIPEGKYSQTFQSRLAGDKWLTPYTDVEVNKMPEKESKTSCNSCFFSLIGNARRNSNGSQSRVQRAWW